MPGRGVADVRVGVVSRSLGSACARMPPRPRGETLRTMTETAREARRPVPMPRVAETRLDRARDARKRRRRGVEIESTTGAPTDAKRSWQPVTVDALRDSWSAALDAAAAALQSAEPYLAPGELHERSKSLVSERESAARLLQALAHDQHGSGQYVHLRLPPWTARRLLGLPSSIEACVFNLDGVLLGSASLHAAAWRQTFDELISRRVERTGAHLPPFNPRTDYPAHMHGRPRVEGVRNFLASRGIRLPEGEPDDPPGLETVQGLANRKNQALRRLIEERGITAFEGSRRYLELVRDAGIRRGVVSASANTDAILARAGLAGLVDSTIDGAAIVAEHLRPRPAADILLAACRRLGVAPEHAAVFETSPAGVRAARAGEFNLVVGVDRAGQADALRGDGADIVVSGLAELLDRAVA
jgi:HAD superfamily hydrolase (TIGR01509 family)